VLYNDLGEADATPVNKEEYDRMRAGLTAGEKLASA
jgi:hypothetical protein